MSSILTISRDSATMVYDDKWRCILEALGGPITVERASNVEFDPATGEWVGTYIPTGEEIARDRLRSKVIADEVAWLERNIITKGESCHTQAP